MTRRSKRTVIVAVAVLAAVLAGVCSLGRGDESAQAVAESARLYQKGKQSLGEMQLTDAYHSFAQCIRLCEQRGMPSAGDSARIRLASIYYDLDMLDECERELATVVSTQDLHPREHALYCVLSAIVASVRRGHHNRAIGLMKQAIGIDRQVGNQTWVDTDMGNLAEMYIRGNRYEEAARLLDELGSRKPKATSTVQYFYCRGWLLLETGRTGEAYALLDSCRGRARAYNMQVEELSSLRLLARIDSLQTDSGSCLRHYKEYVALRDKINGSHTTYQISLIREQGKIEMMQMEQDGKRRVWTYSLAVLMLVAVSLCLLSVSLFLLNRKNKESRRIAELEAWRLNSEITRERLEKELIELKARQKNEELELIKKQKHDITLRLAAIDTDKTSTDDDLYQDIDDQFCRLLESRFPTLTKADIRLAWLIKLRLPSQTILRLLKISAASLYTSRHRLRKRLGLDNNEDLERFILSID